MSTFFKIGNSFLAGRFQLGLWGGSTMSVRQSVHDGDTVHVLPEKNLSIRFLGIDTPEVSFQLPDDGRFLSISHPRWRTFLSQLPDSLEVSPGLRDYLQERVGPQCSENHSQHAEKAHRVLESEVQADIEFLGESEESFLFFLAFAYEALDGYGRLLAYVHPNQPETPSDDRLPSYNKRMLESGLAAPYFIFPNIDPFRSRGSVVESVQGLDTPQAILDSAPKLRGARQAVQRARETQSGIFDAEDPLMLAPFELRFLTRGTTPNRFVINLSSPNDNILHLPDEYYQLQPEDRLWIPEEFVPLFEANGWNITS